MCSHFPTITHPREQGLDPVSKDSSRPGRWSGGKDRGEGGHGSGNYLTLRASEASFSSHSEHLGSALIGLQ